MKNFKSLLYSVLFFCFVGCTSKNINTDFEYNGAPINGLTFVAPPKLYDSLAFHKIKTIGANWVAVIPYGYHKKDNPKVKYNFEWQWWGETKKGVEQTIHDAQHNNLKVMLKPQIYIPGYFTGNMKWNSEQDWQIWEASFKKYILDFAALAEVKKVDLFCIGTEYKNAISARPQFWKELIKSIKKIYSGKLTYASNWDEFMKVPFWEDLDYIGVDAYFELTNELSPRTEVLIKAWEKHLPNLSAISKRLKKPILFTEYGYLSVDNCAGKTWEIEKKRSLLSVNEDCQANAIEALHYVFKSKKYWAGGFLWKWFPNGMGHEGYFNKDYTPQRKKAENIIMQAFK